MSTPSSIFSAIRESLTSRLYGEVLGPASPKARRIFAAFIAIHVSAAVFRIQAWPLTNYPMFSKSIAPFSTYRALYIDAIFLNDQGEEISKERWSRQHFNVATQRDQRLMGYLFGRPTAPLDELVRQHSRRIYNPKKRPQKINIVEATLDPSTPELRSEEKVIHEFSLD